MVYESCYWKDDLRSYAKELSDFSTCTTLEDEHRDYRLEKALLLSAFTVRMLLDANKDAQKNISPLDKRFIDERYFDLASPTSSSISLRQLTNQLIHSAVVVAFSYDNANRMLGFFVVSDNDYENRLCYCSIKEWISMVEAVADDDVIYALIHKDPKTGKCITVKLAASDLLDIDATLTRPKSKGLSPEILDAIRKKLTRMATEESARPNNAANLNDTTPESHDA